MNLSRRRLYDKIGEWAYGDREYGKGKRLSRKKARRRLQRALMRRPEDA